MKKTTARLPRNRAERISVTPRMSSRISCGKAQRGIGKGDASRRPEPCVSHIVGKVEKELSGPAIGVDMKNGEETLGIQPGILVHQGNGTESHHQHENTLGEFECGYRLEQLPL